MASVWHRSAKKRPNWKLASFVKTAWLWDFKWSRWADLNRRPADYEAFVRMLVYRLYHGLKGIPIFQFDYILTTFAEKLDKCLLIALMP